MAAHSSILAWRIPWIEEPSGRQSMGQQRVGHNEATFHSSTPSWITALLWQRGFCNSMKLWARPHRVTQDGPVTVEGSDKMWFTQGGNGSQLRYSCHENTVTVWKGKKIRHWNTSLLGPRCPMCYWGKQRTTTISSRKNEVAGPKWNGCLSCGCIRWWK